MSSIRKLATQVKIVDEIIVQSRPDYIPSYNDCQRKFPGEATSLVFFLCNTGLASTEEADEAWVAGMKLCSRIETLTVSVTRYSETIVVPLVFSRIPHSARFSSSLCRLVFFFVIFPRAVCMGFGKQLSAFKALQQVKILGCRFHGNISRFLLRIFRVKKLKFCAAQSVSHGTLLKLRQLEKAALDNGGSRYLYLDSMFWNNVEFQAYRKWLISHIERVNGLRMPLRAYTEFFRKTDNLSSVLGYVFS